MRVLDTERLDVVDGAEARGVAPETMTRQAIRFGSVRAVGPTAVTLATAMPTSLRMRDLSRKGSASGARRAASGARTARRRRW